MAVSPPDFRPAPPGWTVAYNYAGEFARYPLQGWLLTPRGWQPAFWEDNALRWIGPDDEVHQDLGLREVQVEPASADTADHDAALEDHATAMRGLADAIGRHNAALADHADALGRYR